MKLLLQLQPHHIVDVYTWIDDLLPATPPSPQGGRPPVLHDNELITILVWNAVVIHQKTLKDVWHFTRLHLNAEFPRLPQYQTFVEHCHRVAPKMFMLLKTLLSPDDAVKLVDATMLPVCRLKRADDHKVARHIAAFGKNHQGWHYGFKLHGAINLKGVLCGLAFTPANVYDAQAMPDIIGPETKVVVGDTLYGASVMRQRLWEEQGTIVIAPPHPKQKTKIAAPWQNKLLDMRSKIESVYDILKEHLGLVTSFPRSAKGYLVHYVRILLGYQIIAISSSG